MTRSRSLLPLKDLAAQIAAELPSVRVSASAKGLLLKRGDRTLLLSKGDIGSFSLRERAERRREGRSYAHLATGEVFLSVPGLLVFLKLGKPATRPTPLLCAVLAAALDSDEFDWLSQSLSLAPGVWRDTLTERVGIQLSPSSASKVRKALTPDASAGKRGLTAPSAFELIRSTFRFDSISQSVRLPAPLDANAEWLRARLQGDSRVLEGVASTLSAHSGALIEPRDYLVERSVMLELESTLGGQVGRNFRGPTVTLRGVTRLSLDELDPKGAGQVSLSLALAEALASDDPIQRETAQRLADERWNERRQT